MIKYILAGTAATAVAVTVGVIVFNKDLACEYSPTSLSSLIGCETTPTQAAASTEAAAEKVAQNDDVSPKAGSQEIERKAAEENTKTETTETETAKAEDTTPDATIADEQNVPTFDIVRVEPDGSTLVAGRGAPNAKIILKDGDKNIGETVASDTGEWVIIVDEPIKAATATLSLLAMLPDGTAVESTATVDIAMRNEAPEAGSNTASEAPLIELADAAGAKADEIIAKTDDAAKQTIDEATEAVDQTSEAVEKTVEQAEQLAKEAAALLKKAADMDKAMSEATPVVEDVAKEIVKQQDVVEQVMKKTIDAVKVAAPVVVKEIVEEVAEKTVEVVKEALAKPVMETATKLVENVVAATKTEPVTEAVPTVATETEEFILKAPETADSADVKTEIKEDVAEKVIEKPAEKVAEVVAKVTEQAVPKEKAAPKDNAVADKTTTDKVAVVEKTAAEKTATEKKIVEKKAVDKTPLVVISEKGKATKILQGAGTGTKNNEMTFNSMDYSAKGEIIFSGDAKPNEIVRVYINNEFVGEAKSDDSGRWSLDSGYVMQAGPNSMRFDQVDASGSVISRRETNINMPKLAQVIAVEEPKAELAPEAMVAAKVTETAEETAAATTADTSETVEAKVEPVAKTATNNTKTTIAKISNIKLQNAEIIQTKGGRAIIIWGDNLWNISRKIYGKGELYTTIFKANKDQIRDPNLIYPGQVFLLPDNIELQ